MKIRKMTYLFCFLGILLLPAGCAFGCAPAFPSPVEGAENTWETAGFLTVGHRLTVNDNNSGLTLLNNKDVLASDGLYYASWTMGSAQPFENSNGDTLDLYDAQVYLLLGEFPDSGPAADNMESWLAAGKSNYEVVEEKEIVCNGQAYTLLLYNCTKEDNPYERGASAFGIHGGTAVCIELTCRESYEEDPETMLTDFLDNCIYGSD